MAKRMIRIANPSLTVGVCGSQMGNPSSVKYFDRIGLDNISCFGKEIPGAKVAAAQAYIQDMLCCHMASEDQYKQMPCDVTGILSDINSAP